MNGGGGGGGWCALVVCEAYKTFEIKISTKERTLHWIRARSTSCGPALFPNSDFYTSS